MDGKDEICDMEGGTNPKAQMKEDLVISPLHTNVPPSHGIDTCQSDILSLQLIILVFPSLTTLII